MTQDQPLTGAVIGCGFFAQNHLRGWAELPGVRIAAVCDLDPAKAAAAAALVGGARTYGDAAAMFAAERLDFVDIATTMETHEALGLLAARHGVPAIIQKPFAPEIGGCRRIVAAFAEAGVPLMVHENFRFQRSARAVRAVLDSGRIGRPFFARVSWRTAYDVIAGQPYLAKVERFQILDLGIHLLDIARYLMGEVAQITCITHQVQSGIAGEDGATMLLKHRDGAATVVDGSYSSRRDPDQFPDTVLEIDGASGSIRLLPGHRIIVHAAGRTETIDAPPAPRDWATPPWDNVQDSVVSTQAHFIESLREGRQPATSGADNLATFALVEAAYLSAARGGTVAIEAVDAL